MHTRFGLKLMAHTKSYLQPLIELVAACTSCCHLITRALSVSSVGCKGGGQSSPMAAANRFSGGMYFMLLLCHGGVECTRHGGSLWTVGKEIKPHPSQPPVDLPVAWTSLVTYARSVSSLECRGGGHPSPIAAAGGRSCRMLFMLLLRHVGVYFFVGGI